MSDDIVINVVWAAVTVLSSLLSFRRGRYTARNGAAGYANGKRVTWAQYATLLSRVDTLEEQGAANRASLEQLESAVDQIRRKQDEHGVMIRDMHRRIISLGSAEA